MGRFFEWSTAAAFALCVGSAFAQSPTAGAECERRPGRPTPSALEQESAGKLRPLQACQLAIDDRTACNRFLGAGLDILFGNKDFKTGTDSYMVANDIANGLEQPGNAGWTKIGSVSDQAALDRAQQLANNRKPVVVARLGRLDPTTKIRGAGHVALILPGTLVAASAAGDKNWGDLRTPNAASFFVDRPTKMFIGCPLSAVWARPSEPDRSTNLYTK